MNRPPNPWKPGERLAFDTTRFAVRPYTVSDVDDEYVGWWNDPEIRYGLAGSSASWNLDRATQFVGQFNHRTHYHLAIVPRQAVHAIGFVSLFLEPGDRARSETVIGNKYWWGKGVVPEVRGRLLEVLFDDAGAHRVYGQVHARNIPAILNYKKQGFTCEGILREHVTTPDGERHDALVFGLLATEWAARRATTRNDA